MNFFVVNDIDLLIKSKTIYELSFFWVNILSKNVVFLHLLNQRHNTFLKEKIT